MPTTSTRFRPSCSAVRAPRSFAASLALFAGWLAAFAPLSLAAAVAQVPPQNPPPAAAPATAPQAAPQTPPATPPAATPPTTAAPTTDDIRMMAERLKALEAELAQAKARIAELEAELAAHASNQSGSTPAATPTTPAPGTAEVADEGRILSVSQFFSKAQAEYALAFPPAANGEKPEAAPALKRSLERFAISMNRGWKQQIRWTVVLKKAERSADMATVMVQPINEDGSPRGDVIPMKIDVAHNRRLDTILQRSQVNDVYVINGLFTPRLTVNLDRMGEGVFNNPPLVGPGIEFRYEISVDGMAIVKPEVHKDAKNGDAKSGKKATDGTTTPSAPSAPTKR